MANINQEFLEEYKHLDKLCKEVFDSDKGVTSYIDYMRATPYERRQKIASWESDLKMLVSLRHVRNQLAHEVGSLDVAMVDRDDVEWVRDFYERIMSSDDPISKLRRSSARIKTSSPKAVVEEERKSVGCIGAIIFFIGIAIMFAVAFFSSQA